MVGTQTLKLALPTWDCLSSRSGRPEQGSPPPGARGTAQRAGDREGETPAAAGRPRLTPVLSMAFRGCLTRPVPSRPVRSQALCFCVLPGCRRKEPRTVRLTGPGRSRAPAARGSA